jgi:hypothetical protein
VLEIKALGGSGGLTSLLLGEALVELLDLGGDEGGSGDSSKGGSDQGSVISRLRVDGGWLA